MAHIRSYNHVTLVGRIGRISEPRTRTGKKGVAVYFSLATCERYAGETSGERTDWHNCSAWGTLANFVSDQLTVGSMVLVEGQLRAIVRQEADGSRSSSSMVEARHVIVLRWKKGAGQEEGESEPPPRKARPREREYEEPPPRTNRTGSRREEPRDEDDFSDRLGKEEDDWGEPRGGGGPMDEDEIPF